MEHPTISWSEERAALFKALAAAQSDMDTATKDATNPAFRSRYATLASVLQAVLPALNKHGLALSQHPTLSDGMVGVTTLLTHSSGQWFSSQCSLPLAGRKDGHALKSATTYLRRIGCISVCGLPEDDDDGNLASNRAPSRQSAPKQQPKRSSLVPSRPKPLSPAEVDKRLTDLELTPADLAEWCAGNGKPGPDDMSPSQLQQCLTWLEGGGVQRVRSWLEAQAASDG